MVIDRKVTMEARTEEFVALVLHALELVRVLRVLPLSSVVVVEAVKQQTQRIAWR